MGEGGLRSKSRVPRKEGEEERAGGKRERREGGGGAKSSKGRKEIGGKPD